MRRREDDLTAWQDDPVVRALTGPATDTELAGEEMALAAFRAGAQARSRRRYAGRLGIGGSALTVAIAFSGGVAAAYTAVLPTQVQRVANDVAGWAGVPAPAPDKPKHHGNKHSSGGSTQQAAGQPSGSPSVPVAPPTPTPSSAATSHHHVATKPKPKPKPTPTTPASGSSSPPASPSPTPTPTPTPTQTAPVPGSITITVSASKVLVNGRVSVVANLATSSGAPIANHRVWLIERLTGQSTASQIAMGVTGTDGSVVLDAANLTHSARLRVLAGQGVRSAPVLVTVVPTMSASISVQGPNYEVAVTTDGGDPGDIVTLEQRVPGGWEGVTTTQLDSTGGAAFQVPAPDKRAAHYRIVLRRTQAHASVTTRFAAPPL